MSSDYREQARAIVDDHLDEMMSPREYVATKRALMSVLAAALVAAHAAGLEAGAVIAEADDFTHTSGYRCHRGKVIADSIRSTTIRTAAAKGENP